MSNYSLPTKASYSDIETALDVIRREPGTALTLPAMLKEKGSLGVEGLLCQMIATWMRVNSESRVYQGLNDDDERHYYESLCSSLYGTCALHYATEVLGSNGERVEKLEALESAYSSVRSVLSGEYAVAYPDNYVTMFSFRSKGASKEYNNKLYMGKDSLNREYVKSVILDVIKSVVNEDHYNYIYEFLSSASSIVSELYDNTHNHSRHDVDGSILSENFRAIIIDSSEMNSNRLIELCNCGIKGMLGVYSDWNGWMDAHKRNIPILNISVVDSGPGFARRWTSKPISELTLEEEIEAIEACFTKNRTTSNNHASGSGLAHVMRDIKKLKGLLTLRTGRILVSKSFHNGQGSIKVLQDDMVQRDSFVEGVSFNISVPLVNVENMDV